MHMFHDALVSFTERRVICMTKKKHKKNQKKREKRIENHQENLRGNADKGQTKNQQVILEEVEEKEQRRSTRLGAIIAIVAVMGTVCTFLLKMTTSLLNVWSEQGIIFWCLKILLSLALSMALIIFLDIVTYVIYDLKRYNVLDENYKQLDWESDKRYKCLINDFKLYISVLLVVVFLFTILSEIYGRDGQKWRGILMACLVAIAAIVIFLKRLEHKATAGFNDKLLNVGKEIGKLTVALIFCLSIIPIFILKDEATISVRYNSDGSVEICNTSTKNYDGLYIEIFDTNGEMIYREAVGKENILFAQDDVHVKNWVDNENVAEGVLLNSGHLHWKYILDLKIIVRKSGKYKALIKVKQGGKSVLLLNEFSVDNEEYNFAKESMEKDY